jgi:hypothetical protein
MPEDTKPAGKRTETTVRQYDAAGKLVTETTMITVVATPQADTQPEPGGYL